MNNSVNFNTKSICDGHHNVTYRGVKYIRCPFDYLIYQMVINEVKPDLIIEVGTNNGGGALYMADIMDSNWRSSYYRHRGYDKKRFSFIAQKD